ncbi:MAG: sigma 54-interacting transcriptional regulator, partial [Clostridia bacterium]|nr:sigma 54-interacting transcriptional regulator [Clostridia bacterium]
MRFSQNNIRGIIQLNNKGVIQYADPGLAELVDEKFYGKSIEEIFENYVFETDEKISNSLIQLGDKELCVTQINTQNVITLIVQNCDSLEKVIGLSEKNFEKQIELFLKVMDNENDVTITDGKGIILKVSDSYEKHYDITKNEVIGKSIYELERRGVFSPSVTAIVLKEKRKATVMQKNKLGKNILTTGVPIFDEKINEIKYIVSFNSIDIADLTSIQDKYEKLKQLMHQYYSEINELKLKEIEISGIIAKSASMESIFKMIINIADVDANVLITGETGVGKNLIGKLLHKKSNRSEGRFVEINCGAIPENLLESELFGYERGAFTGADKQGKSGKIYLAHKGTLFLDEIGELSFNMQKKLLQVIQEKKIMKVGGSEYINVDFRLIAATNKDLKKLVDKGEFREDLYYRLNVLPIHIPPLRERKEDILPLIMYFLGKSNKKYK